MTNATKNQRDDLLNPYAIYEAQNTDNTRSLGIRFEDKLCEVYATNDFIVDTR